MSSTEYKINQKKRIIDDNWNSFNGKNSISSGIILYHGSRDGIIGDISPSSRERCDFGSAFYCGDKKEQAELLIKDNGSMKILYTIRVDLSELRVYEFNDTISWALYIAAKRQKIDMEKYKKVKQLADMIDSYDVIRGLIADDEMTQAFGEFLGGALTENGLAYCLSKVDLGYQYAFKSERACRKLHYSSIEPMTKERLSELTVVHDHIVADKNAVVEYALDNIEGKGFRQIMKEWS